MENVRAETLQVIDQVGDREAPPAPLPFITSVVKDPNVVRAPGQAGVKR